MTQENLYTPDCIRTFTGKYVNVFDPKPEMFCIEDIAHGLSMQCRFGGHMAQFYSVAQHSWFVASYVSQENKLAGLLHDASEAYLADIPSPIKHKLPDYKKIEDNLMTVIAEAFGFQYPLSKEIKESDNKILKIEWNTLIIGKEDYKIKCFAPDLAKVMFLDTYEELKALAQALVL